MPLRLTCLTFSALEPSHLARFWADALGWTMQHSGDGVELVPNDQTSFTLQFRPGTAAKTGQNRIHFDLTTADTGDQAGAVAALLARGATHADVGQEADEDHVVLADPEGNELCIIPPTSRFLASCPRLGAVNCDGTHALGVFWSRALDWPLVWDHEEETAIQSPTGDGPKITWSGTPLMPGWGVERIHFHVAPVAGSDVATAVRTLESFGARRSEDAGCLGSTAMLDVDGNGFCVTESWRPPSNDRAGRE